MSQILIGSDSGYFRKDIEDATFVLSDQSVGYTGYPITPTVMVSFDGKVLVPNGDYSVEYADNVSVGDASVIVRGHGEFTGTVELSFEITDPSGAYNLMHATVSLPSYSYAKTGSFIRPTPTVTLNGTILSQGTDYTVTYEDNLDYGTAYVYVSGTGIYSGVNSVSFSIVRRSLSDAVVSLNSYQFSYTGSLVTPEVTVTYQSGGSSTVLVNGVDYAVSYTNNTNRGQAYTVITGKGDYEGTRSVSFQIGNTISSATVDVLSDTYPYTGYAVTPWPIVKLGDVTLVEGVDYTVSFSDNVEVGTAFANVTGINDYSGDVVAPFSIVTPSSSARGADELSDVCDSESGERYDVTSYYSRGSSTPICPGDVECLPFGGFAFVDRRKCHVYTFLAPEYDVSSVGESFFRRGPARRSTYDCLCFGNYGKTMITSHEFLNGIETGDNVNPIIDQYGNTVNEYTYALVESDLSVPYDPSTSQNERLAYSDPNEGGQVEYIRRPFFSPDGKRFFYMARAGSKRICTLVLSRRWDLSSFTDRYYVDLCGNNMSRPFGVGGYMDYFDGIDFSSDGLTLYCIGGSSGRLYILSVRMGTPYDLRTVVPESARQSGRIKDPRGYYLSDQSSNYCGLSRVGTSGFVFGHQGIGSNSGLYHVSFV